MTPNQLPPLPEPDTHCFDDDTGKDVWSYSADQMHAYALTALAQQAQEPWGWAIEDKHGVAQAIRPARKEFFGCIQAAEPFTVEDVEKMGREWPGLAPHRIVKLYATPPAPQVPAPVDEREVWLPIESAPKDGTRLILWWGGKPVFAGWLDNSQCKHPWAGWQTPSLTPRPQGEPTHYMLLPSAPQTKDQP